MALRDFLAYPKPDIGIAADAPKQFTYLDPKNITYPGVAVVAGVILNFIVSNVTGSGTRLWVSLLIALAFGGFILWQSLTDKNNAQPVASQIFVLVVNTVLLWIAIFSVAAVEPGALTGAP
ncbi:hypothetical protein [Microbacterium invictum]|uniref:Membrane-anchored protein n=1 Tax=Microbacterium invictum TaxID=515415 RepID=A0AA40VND0_9MICO|nr:hypothetical protein [Microbacterium invictum]MBB4140777.1 putative membrane-anchored protein [Microbacterium invictum]